MPRIQISDGVKDIIDHHVTEGPLQARPTSSRLPCVVMQNTLKTTRTP